MPIILKITKINFKDLLLKTITTYINIMKNKMVCNELNYTRINIQKNPSLIIKSSLNNRKQIRKVLRR